MFANITTLRTASLRPAQPPCLRGRRLFLLSWLYKPVLSSKPFSESLSRIIIDSTYGQFTPLVQGRHLLRTLRARLSRQQRRRAWRPARGDRKIGLFAGPGHQLHLAAPHFPLAAIG